MVRNRRGAAIGGGFAACCAVALFAFDFMFPQLILPFGWALVLFCGSVFGAAAFAYFGLRAVLWPPMPRLRVRLVLEGAKDDHLFFHFAVENLGPGDVHIDRTLLKIGNRVSEAQNPGARWIPESETLTVRALPVNYLVSERQASLQIAYSLGRRSRTTTYKFELPQANVGPINPTRRGHLNGAKVIGQIDQAARNRLFEPIAWIALNVPEISDTGGPNIVSGEGGGRSFCFDAAAREVWFAVSRKGGIRTLRLSLPNKAQDAYVVTLWWDDEKQYHGLGLNGEVVTFDEPAE